MESVHEEWRAAVGFEGKFKVSSFGKVMSLSHDARHWCGRMIPQPERLIKQSRHSGGYLIVSMRDGKKHYVHRLVMAAFIGEPNGRDVNHINGDKADNRLANLEYCNRLHNVRHAITTGLQDNSGEGNGMHRYTAEQIVQAHEAVRSGAAHAEAALETGVSVGVIESVMCGARWRHLGLSPVRRR